MSFCFLQLAAGSRDLSQAEQIHEITTIFTQNDKFLPPIAIRVVEFSNGGLQN